MKVFDMEQGTDEWLKCRLGKPSGSNFSKLITAQGKPSSTAETYINQCIAEKVMGELTESFSSEWMQRGTELEPQAKAFYEFERSVKVDEVGFCQHDEYECGISPDGLIGEEGGLEIKCPKPSTQIRYLRSGRVPVEYKQQIMGALWITGRRWWDFLSFHPSLPPFLIRVERDEEYIELLAEEVIKACKTIETEVKKIEVLK